MLYEVDHKRMRTLSRVMENIIGHRAGIAPEIITSITSRWLPEMNTGSITVLLWLISRTILLGKAAERLSHRDFIQGIDAKDEVHAAPIGMSRPTLRKHLSELCEADFINIYRIGLTNSSEIDSRMYEINVKKLLNKEELGNKNLHFLVQKSSENDLEGGKKFARGGKKLSTQPIDSTYINFVNSCSSIGLDKSNLSPAGFTAPVLDGETMALGNTVVRLATPKKVRATVQRSDSIATILSSTKIKDDSLRSARAAGAQLKSISKWEMKDIQAVIDKAMRETRPDYPRMIVTGKAFAVFKKRMKEAQIANVNEFVSWCISFWGIIAERNRKAHARKLGQAGAGTPIPSTPEFTAFAYRLPYFIKVYAEGKAGLETSALDSEESKEIRMLKAKLAQATRESAAKDNIIRRISSRPVEPVPRGAPKRITHTATIARREVADIDDLPAWED